MSQKAKMRRVFWTARICLRSDKKIIAIQLGWLDGKTAAKRFISPQFKLEISLNFRCNFNVTTCNFNL